MGSLNIASKRNFPHKILKKKRWVTKFFLFLFIKFHLLKGLNEIIKPCPVYKIERFSHENQSLTVERKTTLTKDDPTVRKEGGLSFTGIER